MKTKYLTLLLAALCGLFTGCGTSFEQRLGAYKWGAQVALDAINNGTITNAANTVKALDGKVCEAREVVTCVTNIVPDNWNVSMPTSSADPAWSGRVVNYFKSLDAKPLVPQTPFGWYTPSNTITLSFFTNASGIPTWRLRMPVVTGQVWQFIQSRDLTESTTTSFGSLQEGGFYVREFVDVPANRIGIFYPRRLK